MDNKMEVDKKLAASLTAESTELIPFLPYLLQDIWELGSSPADMADMIKRHILPAEKELKVLDLGCGKGPVAIKINQETGFAVKGVDITAEFIAEAQQKAEAHGVKDQCTFEVNDINQSVENERGYGVVILGAVGDVLGTPEVTLGKLKQTLVPGGYILLDDAYLTGDQDDVRYINYEYLTLDAWNALFAHQGLEVVEMRDSEADTGEEINDFNNQSIKRRAEELTREYPDKKELFDGYVQSQLNECEDLDQTVVGVTWLLKMK